MAESNSLQGRVALVTGGGAGMGRAHAILMAERGADIVVQDIDRATADDTAGEVRKRGRRALAFAHDVADVRASRAMVEGAEREFGRIDILVNNAGIGGGHKHLEEIDEAQFDRMLGVHVTGHFFLTQAVVPGMKARRMGKIINISSRWAMTGADVSSHYIACKSALLGLTKAWAKELAPWNIHVNAVAPGGVWTDMVLKSRGEAFIRAEEKKVPLGRWAQPVEYAYAVAFLASAESDFITGQVISPNGGMSIVGI
ncbi:MAG: SDR family NAD(P)-dependent oxidoreductase [Alphaproteobacteria bacterium]